MPVCVKNMSGGGEVECPSCGHNFEFDMPGNPDERPDGNAGQEAAEEQQSKPPMSFADALRKRKASK